MGWIRSSLRWAALAALLLPAPLLAQSELAGVYIGTFSSTNSGMLTDSGQFAFMLRATGVGVAVVYDTIDEVGFVQDGIIVAADGSFSFVAFGNTVSGSISASGVGGSLQASVSSNGTNGTFSGTRSASDGAFRDSGGYFPDSLSSLTGDISINGNPAGTVSAPAFAAIIDSEGDGLAFLQTIDDVPNFMELSDDGLVIDVAGNNVFTATTLIDSQVFSGTFNPKTKVASGSFSSTETNGSLTVTVTGSFSLVRGEALPVAGSADADGDGVPTKSDNCPQISNPSQTDTDGDGLGDACDDDDDNDGLSDTAEAQLGTDPLRADSDGDGVNDGAEVAAGRNPLFNEGVLPQVLQLLDIP